jgi:Holliday junction resolvase RusA-like endonuclease
LINFTLPIVAVGKRSTEYRVVPRKGGAGHFVAGYQPKVARDNARNMAALMAPHAPPKPLAGPLRLDVVFRWPWRKSELKRNIAKGSMPHDVKPDFDNCCKQLCDVMQSVGMFTNDSQLAEVRVKKFWTDQGGIDVWLEELGNGPTNKRD